MLACLRLIDQIRPRYWVIENVKGAVFWFKPHLGRPRYVCNPYYLWGFFPDIEHIRVKAQGENVQNRAAERA